MRATKRVLSIVSGLVRVLCAAGMMLYPNVGYAFVILFLDISLLLYGVRLLTYYATMARFMVGGIATFYKGIIVLDFGLFVFGLDTIPQKYAMLYLIVCLAFSGAVDLLRALDAKKIGASWHLQSLYGLGKIATALVCLFFLDSINVLTFLYAIGLLHTAAFQFINAFRKTAIVHLD